MLTGENMAVNETAKHQPSMIHFVIFFQRMYERGKLFRIFKMASLVKPFFVECNFGAWEDSNLKWASRAPTSYVPENKKSD